MASQERGDASYRGKAFLYVLMTSGPEDLLKVGMTHDPLARWSSFHPRWFTTFDLDRSLLVETETRADAQALETALHRSLVAHQCPMPLTMYTGAGGATEWYRGASAVASSFVLDCERRGYVIHRQARDWLAPAMSEALARLDGVVRHAFQMHCAGELSSAQSEVVRALVESHQEFGVDIESMFPSEVREALHLNG